MVLREYQRRVSTTVYAIRLDLETPGFSYDKWGAVQHCKRGDWIVQNSDDVYTVDASVFERTYQRVSGIEFRKTANVWAEEAEKSGNIETKEGKTHYSAGDFVVYNDRDKRDGYAITRAKFHELYEPVASSH